MENDRTQKNDFHSAMRTLNLEEASRMLNIHPVTLQKLAATGVVPGAKIGRAWIFLEVDLVELIRSKYTSRMMQGEHKEVNLCRSTNVKILPSGGSNYTTAEKSYREALGLPIR